MAISHTPIIEAEAAADTVSWAASLRQAQPLEEIFTRFEHYTSLAQLALEDLQMQLASMQRTPVPVGIDSEPPPNVVRFHRG